MEHSTHGDRPTGTALTRLAVSATRHCLTGCAIGEVLGMVIGTALGWSDVQTIVLAVALAFVLMRSPLSLFVIVFPWMITPFTVASLLIEPCAVRVRSRI